MQSGDMKYSNHSGVFFTTSAKEEVGITKINGTETKTVDSLLVLCQVVVHHHHNLLIRDAVFMDNLVGMACISLRAENTSN